MKDAQKENLRIAAQAIYDKKGVNILALDIRELESLADFVIIAEGNVDRHVRALAQEVEASLKEIGIVPIHVEGRSSGDWMVLDYSEFVVHLFMPDMREKYQLEKLWSDGKIIDLEMVTHE